MTHYDKLKFILNKSKINLKNIFNKYHNLFLKISINTKKKEDNSN